MKTDKELLELAAKATGITNCGYCQKGIGTGKNGPILTGIWSPLTDDGDALRLAAKMEISINHFDSFVKSQAFFDGAAGKIVSVMIERCRLEATRRAIVRAAAAIGEKL